MTMLSTVRSVFLIALLLSGACTNRRDRAVIVGGGNQGNFVVASEPNLTPPESVRNVPTGPTTKEIAQQQRIENLESQQKALQAEIERLRREK